MNKHSKNSVENDDEVFDENHWLALARQGDESGWAELHRHYYDRLWRTVNQIVHDPNIAEDVVQEAFMKAFKTISRFRGQSTFSTWIYRIAVNQALDHVRKISRRRKNLGLFPLKETEEDQEHEQIDTHTGRDATQSSETLLQIKQAFGQLPPEQRSVVELRLVQGFSTDETAKILNCRRGTVLSRLYYGCQKLKKILKETRDELAQI